MECGLGLALRGTSGHRQKTCNTSAWQFSGLVHVKSCCYLQGSYATLHVYRRFFQLSLSLTRSVHTFLRTERSAMPEVVAIDSALRLVRFAVFRERPRYYDVFC